MGVVDILLEDAHEEGIKKGIDLGIEKGIDLGIEKGIEKSLRDFIQNILAMYPDWSNEKIASITNAPIVMVENIRKKLNNL